MAETFDRTDEALRAIAVEDGANAPEEMDARIGEELARCASDARLPAFAKATAGPLKLSGGGKPRATGRVIGFAIAASLAAAVLGSLWMVALHPAGQPTAPVARPNVEIATEFMPLMYSSVPYTDAQLVRLEVPREALKNFGLTPADVAPDALSASPTKKTVTADVLVGEDGLARAVRFVRAQRAEGVTP